MKKHVKLCFLMSFAAVLAFSATASQGGFEKTSLQTPVVKKDSGRMGLNYDIYAGGFKALYAHLDMDIDKKAYDLALTAETQGFIGKLFPWKGDYTTSGKTDDGTLIPSLHTSTSSWRKKVKITEMHFNPKGKVLKTSTQVKGHNKIDRNIRPELAADAVDMLTGVLMLFQQTKNAEKCEGSYPVFDGKRRFNVVLKDAGIDTIRKTKYSQFSGDAMKCTIRVEPVAGFKRVDSQRGWMLVQNHTEERDKPPTIWLAQIADNGPVVPVRMEIKSEYGAVVAHLTAAK
ncbi:MAG: DUF3108 domain-containing protein [Alphaproteobacteria bacterium]|nr:DUF3108 domain-containing protein [Alphaproteobacteria bacterium]